MKKGCCIATVFLALALLGIAVGTTYYYYETIVMKINGENKTEVGQMEQLIEKCDNGSTCFMNKALGERCNKTQECDTAKYLSCDVMSGSCRCDEKMGRIFNNMTGEGFGACIGILGASCQENDCVNGAICLRGQCNCDEGRIKVGNKCQILGGQKCVPLKDSCVGNLKCTGPTTNNMTCRCQNPDYQTMDSSKTTCRINIGVECFPFSKSECVEGAECVVDSNKNFQGMPTYKFKCGCQHLMGFIQDGKSCALRYGEKCREDFPCHSDLTCIAGICSCKNLWDSYNPEEKRCIRNSVTD